MFRAIGRPRGALFPVMLLLLGMSAQMSVAQEPSVPPPGEPGQEQLLPPDDGTDEDAAPDQRDDDAAPDERGQRMPNMPGCPANDRPLELIV